MRSMTGFATISDAITIGTQHISVTCTIKALNARFLEANCKLPAALQSLEGDVMRLIKQELRRGHISVIVHISNQQLLKGEIEPVLSTAGDYLHAIELIQRTYNIPGTVTINELIHLPNVFSIKEQTLDDTIKATFLNIIERAIQAVQIGRAEEGRVLYHDLIARCENARRELQLIEKVSTLAIAHHKQKITSLLQELEHAPTDFNKQLLEQKHGQLYDHLEKITFHEEMVRFDNHLTNLLAMMQQDQPELGKRIDFTVQEMTREINTIAAKCSDVAISTHAVNIKLELEKIREQAQNIL